MCGLCGCGDEHVHSEDDHHHDHHSEGLIQIEQDLLFKNQEFARANARYFQERQITVINLMSSPGSGKTTLLKKTFTDLSNRQSMAVVVGDQHSDYDACALQSVGMEAMQINTGHVCHLDAHMIAHSCSDLAMMSGSILFIENIGNLVCPALFDLGEAYKVVILSVAEGDSKPLKYPEMFRKADLLLVTKVDLLPYVDFDLNRCVDYAKRVNPKLEYLSLSARSGEGLSTWYDWLLKKRIAPV
nr:hydrogenase nickel incorporation protein HypB [Legionella jordanis]